MSAVESNPPISQESKSAKKKKAKAEAAAKENAPQPSVDTDATKANVESTMDGSYESPYMKELYKCVWALIATLHAACKIDTQAGASETSRRS